MSRTGTICNIQRYSLHDGPGIRTVVFFKGCPLRCRWCCNPETQNPQPEISYLRSKCIGKTGCGFCENVCGSGAVEFDKQGGAVIEREKCVNCLRCAEICPSKAIRAEGRAVTASEILDATERDAVFYRDDGGLTISGGEPLMQGAFLLDVLEEAKRRKISTALETCGFGEYGLLRQAAALLNGILYDIKSMDPETHQIWTGRDNALILENFRRLCQDIPALSKTVRIPVIPGFNDSEIAKIQSFLSGFPNVSCEALSYHRFGVGKYAALGREYAF